MLFSETLLCCGLRVQLDGEKTVVLFDPLYSRYAYIDYHNKCVYCSVRRL